MPKRTGKKEKIWKDLPSLLAKILGVEMSQCGAKERGAEINATGEEIRRSVLEKMWSKYFWSSPFRGKWRN